MRQTLLVILFLYSSIPLAAQSPYRVSWEKESILLLSGSSLSLFGLIKDHGVAPLTQAEVNTLSRTSVNMFDRSATYQYSATAATASDVLFAVTAAAPLIMFSDKMIRDDWQSVGIMYAETWALVGATTILTKSITQRVRPFVYNPAAPLSEKLTVDARKSFFSGHTTGTFASAVFLSTVFEDYYPHSPLKTYIWIGSLAAASATGFLRYEAGAHFPTDIITGAVVGSAIGYFIPWLHRTEQKDMALIPAALQKEQGITIQVHF